jgi:hypothetical protein
VELARFRISFLVTGLCIPSAKRIIDKHAHFSGQAVLDDAEGFPSGVAGAQKVVPMWGKWTVGNLFPPKG